MELITKMQHSGIRPGYVGNLKAIQKHAGFLYRLLWSAGSVVTAERRQNPS